KWSAVISAPTGISASSLTRNSATLRFGSTFATEVATFGFGDVLDLARAGAKLQRDVAVLVLGAVGDDLAIRKAQHRYRHMHAGVSEDPGHPDLLCDHTGTHGSVLDS